jgi:hypothetical protein
MQRFNLKKLKTIEVREKDCIDVSKRFTALEELGAEVELIVLGK